MIYFDYIQQNGVSTGPEYYLRDIVVDSTRVEVASTGGALQYTLPQTFSANATIDVTRSYLRFPTSTNILSVPDSVDEFAKHYNTLTELKNVADDGRVDELPSDTSIAFAKIILDAFRRHDFVPSRVVASADGGVAICVVKEGKYSDIECLNAGTILAVNSDKYGLPKVWAIERNSNEIDLSVVHIQQFIGK